MNAIEFSGVSKRFRKVTLRRNYGTLKSAIVGAIMGKSNGSSGSGDNLFTALNGVSFTVPKGETWGIIGRNGSGKSTILKLMAGIYRPDRGDVSINGRVSALIELGAGFHPEFSGRENIFINASILGLPKREIEEKFDDIVAFAELADFIDNPVRTYSSGMFMRLGFSVAIHSDPDVLLVDEVLAVGDEAFGHKCQERLESFKRAGKTIVIVSHSLGDIRKWCDGVIWVDKGEIRLTGKPTRVVDAYLTTVAEMENTALLDKEKTDEPKRAEQANRWGTREIEITGVRILDGAGEERMVFKSGGAMKVEIGYNSPSPIAEPVFGVAIYKSDGGHCYGTNTHLEDVKIERLSGTGSIVFEVDRLDLVDGAYTISVAAHAKDGHPYDYHDQMYGFTVRSKIMDEGVFRPPHRWNINGEVFTPVERE
ncbi:MAG: ABC transporter ATP-binding protein [Nitrospinae bacterium]|nr:ABC transporter ATP-binding protein [Nitrospinota bacterium]